MKQLNGVQTKHGRNEMWNHWS